nr:response regulator transcription factor [Dyella sp. ASV24]
MKIRTVIADDHSLVRSCIRKEIETMEWIQVTLEVSSPHQLVAELRRTPCELLIMDFNMPGGPTEDGLPLLDCVLAHHLALSIIVVTMVTQSDALRAIHERNVSGIVSKTDSLGAISIAVRTAAAGARYISPTVQSIINSPSSRTGNGHTAPPLPLNESELRVLRLFVSGRSFGEIAALLGSSMTNVARLKMDAMRKLGIRRDLDLYGYALGQGFSI